MKTYSVYYNNQKNNALEESKFVEERFSVFAFLVPWAWAAANRLWLAAAIMFVFFLFMAAVVVQNGLLDKTSADIIRVCVYFGFGLMAPDILAKGLVNKNYVLQDVVIAKNLEEAQKGYFNKILAK